MLFTTPSCPNCPKAKELLNEKNVEYESIDASTPEGLEKAKELGIMQVPTLVTDDKKIISGIDQIENFLNGM